MTICSAHRKRIFGTVEGAEVRLSAIGVIADEELRTMPSHYENVELVEHVIMPNHVHAIIMIDGEHLFSSTAKMSLERAVATFSPPEAGSLSAIIRSYKAGVTQRAREGRSAEDVWQAGFYGHILRGEKVIAAVREYIRENPENWEKDRDNFPTILQARRDVAGNVYVTGPGARDVASNLSTKLSGLAKFRRMDVRTS